MHYSSYSVLRHAEFQTSRSNISDEQVRFLILLSFLGRIVLLQCGELQPSVFDIRKVSDQRAIDARRQMARMTRHEELVTYLASQEPSPISGYRFPGSDVDGDCVDRPLDGDSTH